ncbi:LCP family protein required for cell wall assembly [Arthrobacter sp. CAN_A212]|uniref:LCP family glycopolymer transferase n=1 Tax=Arthrobacter sp. CAN_A212 TaxID=2787719 RepID=UPI0018C97B48
MSPRSADAGHPAEGAAASPGGRHLGRSAPQTALKIIAGVLATVLIAGAGFASVQLLRLQGNVLTQPLNLGTDQDGDDTANIDRDPVQILILGTDTREGSENAAYGGEEFTTETGNSDVMMMMHLSADRENVTMVSFPRDLLVPLPACLDPESGTLSPAQDLAMLNGALGNGGPGCTVAAINELTGLKIDHFMMADFKAVKELSSTLGGVEVCVNQAIEDTYSGLSLPAGTSEVEGEQALAFLRTRHGFADGGDEGRIRAQQSFMASMARKITEEGTLNNLPRMYAIAETITRNLTVDDGLSQIPDLLRLADRLKDVDLAKVAFVTMPVLPYEPDLNRLVPDEERAAELFETLVDDRSIIDAAEPEPSAAPDPSNSPGPSASSDPSASGEASQEPSAEPSAEEEPDFDPAAVPFTVIDSSGETDRGEEILELLQGEGYTQAVVSEDSETPATQLFVGPGYEAIATAVAELFGLADVQVLSSPATVGLALSVGADFTSGSTVTTEGLPPELSGQTADQVTCQSSFGS